MRKNIITDTDAYKIPHHLQYIDNLTKLYSYGESRVGSKYPFVSFFGLQMIIEDHFLQRVTDEMIEEAEYEAFMTFGTHNYFNVDAWKRVKDLGYLPIHIKAVPEGTRVGIDNVLFTMESTEEWFAKTMNSLEGPLMHTWYPTTIATRAMYIKENTKPYFDKSSDITDLIMPVSVNDFGYRGATCHEAAARGGAGFLLHYIGSDNMPASRALKDYYGYPGRLKSVWATEHSVATSYGPGRGEFEYVIAQLTKSDPDKIVSIVIDSYDADNFIHNVIGSDEIKNIIIQRPGRVMLRPDTGKPLVNVCKYSDMLGGIFGFTINSKQYKTISNNVGIIQGDGMDENSIPELYREYIKTGWAADNVLTGSGGGLLQIDANRDTQRFAIKAAYGEKDGVPFNLNKAPKTDTTKTSKAGRLKLHRMGGKYMTISSSESSAPMFNNYTDSLRTVFENGDFHKLSFDQVLSNSEN